MMRAIFVLNSINFLLGIGALWIWWPMWAIGPCSRFGWWCDQVFRP